MWAVAWAGSWKGCLGCIMSSSFTASSHLQALCRGDCCSLWFGDEMHREPQVPQAAHGRAGNRSQSAVTHQETTPTPPGVSSASPVWSSGLPNQQPGLICQRQTSPCLLQVIFPSILVLTAKTAVPAHQRGNARAGGSGTGNGWPRNAEKLLMGQRGHGEAWPPSTAQSYQRSFVFLLWHQI